MKHLIAVMKYFLQAPVFIATIATMILGLLLGTASHSHAWTPVEIPVAVDTVTILNYSPIKRPKSTITVYQPDTGAPLVSYIEYGSGSNRQHYGFLHLIDPNSNTSLLLRESSTGINIPLYYQEAFPSQVVLSPQHARYAALIPALGIGALVCDSELQSCITDYRLYDARSVSSGGSLRFLSPDPLGTWVSQNQYQYATETDINPLQSVDPTGLQPDDPDSRAQARERARERQRNAEHEAANQRLQESYGGNSSFWNTVRFTIAEVSPGLGMYVARDYTTFSAAARGETDIMGSYAQARNGALLDAVTAPIGAGSTKLIAGTIERQVVGEVLEGASRQVAREVTQAVGRNGARHLDADGIARMGERLSDSGVSYRGTQYGPNNFNADNAIDSLQGSRKDLTDGVNWNRNGNTDPMPDYFTGGQQQDLVRNGSPDLRFSTTNPQVGVKYTGGHGGLEVLPGTNAMQMVPKNPNFGHGTLTVGRQFDDMRAISDTVSRDAEQVSRGFHQFGSFLDSGYRRVGSETEMWARNFRPNRFDPTGREIARQMNWGNNFNNLAAGLGGLTAQQLGNQLNDVAADNLYAQPPGTTTGSSSSSSSSNSSSQSSSNSSESSSSNSSSTSSNSSNSDSSNSNSSQSSQSSDSSQSSSESSNSSESSSSSNSSSSSSSSGSSSSSSSDSSSSSESSSSDSSDSSASSDSNGSSSGGSNSGGSSSGGSNSGGSSSGGSSSGGSSSGSSSSESSSPGSSSSSSSVSSSSSSSSSSASSSSSSSESSSASSSSTPSSSSVSSSSSASSSDSSHSHSESSQSSSYSGGCPLAAQYRCIECFESVGAASFASGSEVSEAQSLATEDTERAGILDDIREWIFPSQPSCASLRSMCCHCWGMGC